MRWNEILTESLTKYRPMFTALYPDGKVPKQIEQEISKIERVMKREDRTVWALRWFRWKTVYNMVGSDLPTPDERKMLDRAKRDLGEARSMSDDAIMDEAQEINLTTFEHFFSMPVDPIKKLVFDKQLPSEILSSFDGFEEEWQDSRENEVSHKKQNEEIIDFGNGWAWWNLHTPYCSDEGDAMGHCGNSAAYKNDDTILSLRKHVWEDKWEPHVTFILDSNGFIGEMKGRNNEKPVERYHDMIITLLKNPIVYGIKGGGYAPEENFSLSDLSPSDQEMLRKLKPGFRSITELMQEGNKDVLQKAVLARLHTGYSYEVIDMEKNEIVISTWKSLEKFIDDQLPEYNQAFITVRDELVSSDRQNGEEFYDLFYHDYYLESIKEHIYDFNNYRADVGFDWHGLGEVKMTISFRSFDYCSDPDDQDTYLSNLEEKYEGQSISDADPDYTDEIDEELCLYVDSQSRKNLSALVGLINDEYANMGKYSFGSPTTKDPRQMSLDL